MIETSSNISALTAAIIKVQGAVSGVNRDGANPHFKSRYATLENVIDTAKPALQEAQIAFTQAPGIIVDGSVEVTTMLLHSSGEWMRSTLHVPLGKRDPQGVGSAITYGCRYSLMAMLGLPPTDDDGESAMDRSAPAQQQQQAQPANGRKFASSASLKRGGRWPEMMKDIEQCGTVLMLQKCRDTWSKNAATEKWSPAWCDAAAEEFEKAEAELRSIVARETEDA